MPTRAATTVDPPTTTMAGVVSVPRLALLGCAVMRTREQETLGSCWREPAVVMVSVLSPTLVWPPIVTDPTDTEAVVFRFPEASSCSALGLPVLSRPATTERN